MTLHVNYITKLDSGLIQRTADSDHAMCVTSRDHAGEQQKHPVGQGLPGSARRRICTALPQGSVRSASRIIVGNFKLPKLLTLRSNPKFDQRGCARPLSPEPFFGPLSRPAGGASRADCLPPLSRRARTAAVKQPLRAGRPTGTGSFFRKGLQNVSSVDIVHRRQRYGHGACCRQPRWGQLDGQHEHRPAQRDRAVTGRFRQRRQRPALLRVRRRRQHGQRARCLQP